MRVAAALLALPLLLLSGAVALADDGGPSRTVGRATELPPRRDATKELLMLVGGLGSSADDGTWDALIARYQGDPRFEIRRFGADPRYPYDTRGDVEASAIRLRDEIRSIAHRYTAVHLVTHSMGGVVADRALADGLSSADGVRTYIALAAPHNGATAARVARTSLSLAGDESLELRAVTAGLVHDPGGDAVRDLAERRSSGPAAGLARIDVRLATDLLVSSPDSRSAGVESRILLPSSFATLEGHGGILEDPAVLDLITTTVATGAPPPDTRGAVLRGATELASRTVDELGMLLLLAAAAAALALAQALRIARYPRAFTRPAAERVIARR
ncbi:MAG TPA: hypothetical protein VFW12_01610 [Candidatus Limnocylindria bacterium]|nr:hypothetical protein [Candidatus Limnocylindria bacterium]